MRETPILFKGLMVRATLEGKKTHTCRTKGLEAINKEPGRWRLWGPVMDGRASFTDHPLQGEKGNVIGVRCPYGSVGDRLWGKETFTYITKAKNEAYDRIRPDGCPMEMIYRADVDYEIPARWTASILMPRWASRLAMEIVALNVWRVQDLPLEIYVKEGIEDKGQGVGCLDHKWGMIRGLFYELWDSINAKRGLGVSFNPWVWGIEYRLIHENSNVV
jgi:hypothetical protein